MKQEILYSKDSMDNNEKLRIGIIGTGWVARMRHLPAWRRNKGVEVVSVYNPEKDLVETFAKTHEIANSFTDLDKFFETVDVVSICTPPMNHFDLAKAALNAGKHVLLEKPITMNSVQAEELAQLAKEKNKLLCPAHNFLFCRAMTKAQRLMSEGKIGKIVGVMGIQWSSHKRELPTWFKQLPGNLFFDESPHLLYLMDFFLKDAKIEDAWFNSVPISPESDPLDRFEAKMKGENGYGLLTMWFGAPMSEWFIVVCGTKGAFILDIFRDVLIYYPEEGKRTPQYLFEVIYRGDRQIWSQMLSWVVSRFTKGSHMFGIDNLVNQFVDSIKTGSKPPLTPHDGKRIMVLIEDILNRSGQNEPKS